MSAATLAPSGRANVVANTLTIARRNLLHIRANPEQLVEMSIQPLMFLLLFVYVFGGAISGSGDAYLQFVLPGILVQGMAFTPFTTALGLNKDFSQGIVDRFRSLPISRSAPIAGRITADAFRIVWSVFIMVGFGMLLGFRFQNGLVPAIGGLLLVVAFGLAMCWPMAFIGITAKSPESVNTWGFMIILPLTFASSTFVPTDTMPGWLQAFAEVQPITRAANALRALTQGGPVAAELAWTAVWSLALLGLFAPMAVRRYRLL